MITRIPAPLLAQYDLELLADFLTCAGLPDIRYGFLNRSLVIGKRFLTTTRVSKRQGSELVVSTSMSSLSIVLLAVVIGSIIGAATAVLFPELPHRSNPGIISFSGSFLILFLVDTKLCLQSKYHFETVTFLEHIVSNKAHIDRFENMLMTDENESCQQ